jgi:hypothetical protein
MGTATAICGNGIVEAGETCDTASNCPVSCPARECTLRKLTAGGTCMARCEDDRAQTACMNADGCCPVGCTEISDSDCVPPNLMFTSSTTYRGDLGGIAGADAKCQERARAAGLAGTFIAFLSTAQASAFSRLDGARGWIRTDGRPVADTVQEMIQARVLYPPRIDEFGKDVVGDGFVATGTGSDGQPEPGQTGNDWGPAPASAPWLCHGGDAAAGSKGWFSNGHKGCELTFRLYCFETSRRSVIALPAPTGKRIAFVSNAAVNLVNGIADADRACSIQATAAGLPGSFKGLLATSGAGAASRFNLTGAPWFRPDGVQIVTTPRDIASVNILAPISVTADGLQRMDNHAVWTGAIAPESIGSATCKDWTSRLAGESALTGTANRSDIDWFNDSFPTPCSASYAHVYCLQE